MPSTQNAYKEIIRLDKNEYKQGAKKCHSQSSCRSHFPMSFDTQSRTVTPGGLRKSSFLRGAMESSASLRSSSSICLDLGKMLMCYGQLKSGMTYCKATLALFRKTRGSLPTLKFVRSLFSKSPSLASIDDANSSPKDITAPTMKKFSVL